MLKPISTALSPNTEKDDVRLALKLFFQPWKYKSNENASRWLEGEFKKYLGVRYAFSFNSGRSALMAILDALDIKEGDEVLLQAFTCNAAVNPILKKRAKPVFVDVDDTINMDPEDLKKKITQNSRAVMIQHTFGWPAQIDEILKIVKENNLYLIEDCAHSLGAKYKGKFCGIFGDAAFFSFGRDKMISSVFGGMAVTNDEKIGGRLEEFQKLLDFPSNFWIFQQLLHPILISYKILPAYRISSWLGRIVLGLFHKLSILSKAVYKKEKRGTIPRCFPKRLPNALALLALNQFKKIEIFNQHRQKIAELYKKELGRNGFLLPLAPEDKDRLPVFMRYPVLADFDTDRFLREARKKKIYLDDGWRKSSVVPPDTDLGKMNYITGSCPRAEKISQSIVNLPTHINISREQARKIINFLKKYGNQRN